MNRRIGALKLLLAIFCVVNVLLGIVAFSSNVPLILKIADLVYGIKLTALEPHTLYTVRMLGCFLLAIGVMSGFAAKDPVKNKAVVYGNIVWLIMRDIQRIIELKPHHDAFGTPYPVIWLGIIFVFLVAGTLFMLLPKGEDA
ncbi:MAG: hypothetical protein COX40_02860 [Candidatus Omnitrophica bacterium CG23_combo_of_CG06-09_8_20_14_all_40_11]|nr:MAG: hypothetical protein COX40_02860 [Candidatus Omnitrophica bacterium CG23_combo_of_CG06-09_8_20_14_all_40_11]